MRTDLVAVSGGAYRAGFWTTAVLDELSRRGRPGENLEGIGDHIRLITGASGGMVGAAYFVTQSAPGAATITDRMVADTCRDSLSPVVQQLVQTDIPLSLLPLEHQSVDRGIVLERQWKGLNRPFSESYEAECRGERPSLIVSPMIIETGRRMLISNLDLGDIFDLQQAEGSLPSADEFFREFPCSQGTFGLNTAVRMNATFPYISPAVSLPTAHTHRPVDAGYYDNYGVDLAVAWAFRYHEWIRANTSGIALIKLQAYASFGPAEGDEAGPGQALFRAIGRAFQWMTSPVEGAMSARDWSMLFRNDAQIRLLKGVYNADRPAGFSGFETFVFACPGESAMNWFITEGDIARMKSDISAPGTRNANEMSRLADWWRTAGR